jgi:5-methylcytosine-specific restriction endonuclease McrA
MPLGERIMARNYGKEYQDFHANPIQKKRRAARNKATRQALASGARTKGDGKEVDHKVPLSKGGSNSKANQRVISRPANRKKGIKIV